MNDFKDTISPNSLLSALKILNNPRQLGQHQLTNLYIVKSKKISEEHLTKSLGMGFSLRDVILDGINQLKPNEEKPNYQSRSWRSYGILTELYVNERDIQAVADTFGYSKRHFHRVKDEAIAELSFVISEFEYKTRKAQTKSQYPVPFTAPTKLDYELIGRDEFLQQLQEKLLCGENRSVAVYGLPGVGKTALVSELLYQPIIRNHFSGGIFWASFGKNPNIRMILTSWALNLGYTDEEVSKSARLDTLKDLLRRTIGPKKILIVLDDVWQLEHVSSIRMNCDNSVYLITTRQPLVAVDFAREDSLKLRELQREDGINLINRLVPGSEKTYSLPHLVRAVGGLPLAIHILGRFLRTASIVNPERMNKEAVNLIADTEQRLKIEFPQLLPGYNPNFNAEASISLEAIIELSVDSLDHLARQSIIALSVFCPKSSTFSLDAVTEVTQVPLHILDELIFAGLLESGGDNRFTIHRTLNDYLCTKLDENKKRKRKLYERMIMYYFDLAFEHQNDFKVLRLEASNLEAAEYWSHSFGLWKHPGNLLIRQLLG